ncbi:unnamed protein product [Somion occarium]|uniref:Outer spore wall protein RRT8 n=1 Tax=Somion occarium TaxID=3059160 RepID=A0ABP1E3N6_9APHY
MSTVDTVSHHPLVQQLREEASEAARLSGQALASLAWLWPIRGIIYTVTHPQVVLSVHKALLTSLITSTIIFLLLAFFTYIPQAAFLSIFTGLFIGPVLALLLIGAESVFFITFFARALFLEPALSQVFDATLVSRGQSGLVRDGKTKYASSGKKEGIEGALVRPFQALSRDGFVKYLVTLPLNFVPVIGTVAFLFLNGYRGGPGWHARYFQLKGWDVNQRKRFIQKKRAEYTAFGMMTLLFTFIPLIGLVFSFTNTVGAALWAAEMEAQENLIDKPQTQENAESTQSESSRDKAKSD